MRVFIAFLVLCMAAVGCSYEPVKVPEGPIGDGDGHGDGDGNGDAGADASISDASDADVDEGVELQVAPYSQVATRWSDYVLASDHALPCPAMTPVADCVHAGAWRKVIVPDEASCTDLEASDGRGWFDWTCSADTGEVVLVGRLRVDIGLADLIDVDALSWRMSRVVITRDDDTIAWAEASLWEEMIRQVPESSEGVIELDEERTVYVARAASDAVVRISADRVAFLDATGTQRTTFDSSDGFEIDPALFFIWIEGLSFDLSESSGVVLEPFSNGGVRNITVARDELAPIATADVDLRIDTEGSTLVGLHSSAAAGTGILIQGARNEVRTVEVAKSAGDGLVLQLADSVVSNVRVASAAHNGVHVKSVTGTTLEGISIADCKRDGLLVDDASRNDTFADLVVTNNDGAGIALDGSDHRVSLALSASNTRSGFRIEGHHIILTHITSVNNAFAGFQLGLQIMGGDNPMDYPRSGFNTEIVNVVSTNNEAGMVFHFDSERTYVHDAWIATNTSGHDLHIDANHNVFTGTLALSSTETCFVNDWWEELLTNPGIDDSNCGNAGDSTATITHDAALQFDGDERALIAHQTKSDPENAHVLLVGRLDHDEISDWFNFQYRHRHWGRPLASAIFPDLDSLGRCSAGTKCAIWDWRVTHADTLVRDPLEQAPSELADALIDDVHVRTHEWFANDPEACSTIRDAQWDDELSECTTRFLAYAFEPRGDGFGNDNFLCEPDERCILNRNRGAYPGDGELSTLTAGDQPGRIQIPSFGSITLDRYDSNGP